MMQVAVKSKKAPLTLVASPVNIMGKTIKAGVCILSPLTGTLVNPEGIIYPPSAESAFPDVNFLRIGPPWPEDIRSESGGLPECVIYENGKWAPYTDEMQKVFEKLEEEEIKRKEKMHDVIRPYYFRQRARVEIELVVDGDIVDLNRIPLPPDTPIIDKRFKDNKAK